MDMKRFACGALAAAMLAVPALAAEPEAKGADIVPISSLVQPREGQGAYSLHQWNKVFPAHYTGVAANLEEGRLSLKDSLKDEGLGKIILNVSDETLVLDAATGETKAFSDVKEGDSLSVYTSPMMNLSMPPQSTAQIILCNLPENGTVPVYVEIQQVEKQEDGSISILTSDDTVLHLGKETTLFPYLTRQAVSLESFQPGDRILAWYDVVMESYPAQANPTKVMLFPNAYKGWISAAAADELSVNGEELTQDGLVVDGKLMLPVRAVAEALGLEVQWNAETPDQVTVVKPGSDLALYKLTLDSKEVVRDGDEVSELELATLAQDGVTYMDANAMINFHELKLEGQWPSL